MSNQIGKIDNFRLFAIKINALEFWLFVIIQKLIK